MTFLKTVFFLLFLFTTTLLAAAEFHPPQNTMLEVRDQPQVDIKNDQKHLLPQILIDDATPQTQLPTQEPVQSRHQENWKDEALMCLSISGLSLSIYFFLKSLG